jgi:hypothetical protein
MMLSPYTLSTHNCFVHAIIVTFANLAINIIDIPVFFSFPDVVPQFVTWSNNYTLHALITPVSSSISYTTPHHTRTRAVPIYHSRRWAFCHIVCGHCRLRLSSDGSLFDYIIAVNVIDILDFFFAYSP